MRILTLCEDCAGLYNFSYAVKKIAFKTTTQKKEKCEHCGQPERYGLYQWTVEKKPGSV